MGTLLVPRWSKIGHIFGATCVVLIGIGHQQLIGQPAHFQLLTAADMVAMQWIRQETPPDARFFVNSFPAYQGALYAGTDGGWWLPFLSGRQSNLPPITYGSEAGLWRYYSMAVNHMNANVQRYALDSPAAVAALREEDFSYLYDGPAALPAAEYIDPHVLAQSALYELVYSHAGVTIWRIR